MNSVCFEAILADVSISMMCKSWVWMYTKILTSERWRRWHGGIKYPFYHPEFSNTLLRAPEQFLDDEATLADFYSCCEHWFDCCLLGNEFEIQKDLPDSGGGLGLVSLHDANYRDMYESVFGILEFVDERMFSVLKKNNYPSLYETAEGDLCIVIGPLSLCNNGRLLHPNKFYPRFKDRNMLTDEELIYESMRKQFFRVNVLPPLQFVMVLFDHFALRMHIVDHPSIAAGEQLFVDYGFVTVLEIL
jgi:hypothetical protein